MRGSARFHNFGYERDLQPDALQSEIPQLLSGAAQRMERGSCPFLNLLTLIAARRAKPLHLRHEGSYFETRDLIELAPNLYRRDFSGSPDLMIAEPLWCDGECFGSVTPEEIAAKADGAKFVIVDSTLVGLDDGLNPLLASFERDTEVFRLHSGLKLFQKLP